MTVKKEKISLRSRLIDQRNFLYNKKSKEFIDAQVLITFEELIKERAPKQVGLYKSFGSELDTLHLDTFLRANNIEVYYPKIQNEEMIFVKSNSPDDFTKGANGFPEPSNCDVVGTPECVVTPSLAIDKELFRLGYGRGYYDRYIAKNPGYFVSFILKNFIVEVLPRDLWDSKINKVIAINVPSIDTLKK